MVSFGCILPGVGDIELERASAKGGRNGRRCSPLCFLLGIGRLEGKQRPKALEEPTE